MLSATLVGLAKRRLALFLDASRNADRAPLGPPAVRLLLLHPLAVTAVAVLVVNDHLVKSAWPGVVSGKLSDIAGLVFFPLLLASVAEVVVLRLGPRRLMPLRVPPRLALGAAIVLTAVGFTLVKTVAVATAAFDLALGFGQWVVAFGPISGAMIPTSTTTDPHDLVALPALAVAWWIGEGQSTKRRVQARVPGQREGPRGRSAPGLRTRPVATAMLIVAGLASMATSPATKHSSTGYEETLQLTADRPAAVRHLAFSVTNRDRGVVQIGLRGSLLSEGASDEDLVQEPSKGVLLVLMPDPPTQEFIDDTEPEMFGLGQSLDLTERCRTTCAHEVTAVVRLLSPVPGQVVETTLGIDLFASGQVGEGEVDIDLSLQHHSELAFDGEPSTVTAASEGTIRVSSDRPRDRVSTVIRIAGEVLKEPLAYPLVGRVLIQAATTDASDHPHAHRTDFTVGTDELIGVGGGPPTSRDLLVHCDVGVPCEIPVTIASEYDPTLNSPDFDPADSRPGFVELHWSIDVRLEAYDGRDLPSDSINIDAGE